MYFDCRVQHYCICLYSGGKEVFANGFPLRSWKDALAGSTKAQWSPVGDTSGDGGLTLNPALANTNYPVDTISKTCQCFQVPWSLDLGSRFLMFLVFIARLQYSSIMFRTACFILFGHNWRLVIMPPVDQPSYYYYYCYTLDYLSGISARTSDPRIGLSS